MKKKSKSQPQPFEEVQRAEKKARSIRSSPSTLSFEAVHPRCHSKQSTSPSSLEAINKKSIHTINERETTTVGEKMEDSNGENQDVVNETATSTTVTIATTTNNNTTVPAVDDNDAGIHVTAGTTTTVRVEGQDQAQEQEQAQGPSTDVVDTMNVQDGEAPAEATVDASLLSSHSNVQEELTASPTDMQQLPHEPEHANTEPNSGMLQQQQQQQVVATAEDSQPHQQETQPSLSTLQQVQHHELLETTTTVVAAAVAAVLPPPLEEYDEEENENMITVWEPNEQDVLSGRGASVNAHGGNKRFRALCFARKPEFEAGNHAAKRRIASEIVSATIHHPGTNNNSGGGGGATTIADIAHDKDESKMLPGRFLKKKKGHKGPWFEMSKEQAILKACQVMRDHKRPDRLAIREMMAQNNGNSSTTTSTRRRTRSQESTPMLETPIPTGPLEPIIENPFGVHDHDILSGRGAFVNGHVGNQRLRKLALERKDKFDLGNYTDKRSLAVEIVGIIKSLDPPGRFLKRSEVKNQQQQKQNPFNLAPRGLDGGWEELSDEKAIHKACQVMRDIDRPDRKDREVRRATKKKQRQQLMERREDNGTASSAETTSPGDDATSTIPASVPSNGSNEEAASDPGTIEEQQHQHQDIIMAAAAAVAAEAEKTAVEEAVAATEEALDKALDAANNAALNSAAAATTPPPNDTATAVAAAVAVKTTTATSNDSEKLPTATSDGSNEEEQQQQQQQQSTSGGVVRV